MAPRLLSFSSPKKMLERKRREPKLHEIGIAQCVATMHSVAVSACADLIISIRSDRRKKPIAIGRRASKGKSEGGQNAVRISPEIARTGGRQGASARAGCDAGGGGGTFGDHEDRPGARLLGKFGARRR